MSELRFYVRRDGPEANCAAWAWLDGSGRAQRTGTGLDELPAERRCRLVLAADTVLTRPARLPDLPSGKLAALLPAAAEAATLDDAEQSHVVLLAPPRGGSAPLAVTRRTVLARALAQLRARDLHPAQAVPEYLLLPWQAGEWSVLANEDGAVVRFDAHTGAALDRGDPPAGLTLALRQGPPPGRIRLFLGSSLTPPDPAAWSAALGLPVESAGRWDWREADWNDAANLLTGNFSAAPGGIDWRALLRPLAFGAVLLAGVQLAGMTLDWLMQSREQAAIRTEMRALAERILPARAAVVDPTWQVAEKLRGLRAGSGGGGDGAMALLAGLGRVWPAEGDLVPRRLDYSGRELVLVLAGAEEAWLAQLTGAGAARGLAVSADREADGQVRLRVRATATGGQP